jgi:hypothetical protein
MNVPDVTDGKARITVSRRRDNDARHRHISLYIDGVRWTELQYGQSATRELRPGHHTLKADNTLFRKSLDFDVTAGEAVRFSVTNREGPGTSLLLLLGAPWLYLSLDREASE